MRRTPRWCREGDPSPPQRWGRRYGPAPFIRFIGCFFVAILFVALLAGGLFGALFGREAGGGHSFFPFFLIPLFVVILIVVAIGGGIRRIARPMDNLISAARRVESGDYSAQVPEWGPSDIRSAARAFNSLSARPETIDEQRRSFLAHVTHEPGTPPSVIQGQAVAVPDRC